MPVGGSVVVGGSDVNTTSGTGVGLIVATGQTVGDDDDD